MARLTRVEYIKLHGKDDVKVINTYNAFTDDLTSRCEPGIEGYKELEKLSRYEDVCDDPGKLLLCVNMQALNALKRPV